MTVIDKTTQLQSCRAEIDAIDMQILSLLEARMKIVDRVGHIKHEDVLSKENSFIRPGREATMLRHLCDQVSDPSLRPLVAEIWRLIISAALMRERPLEILCVDEGWESDEEKKQIALIIQRYFSFCSFALVRDMDIVKARNSDPSLVLFISEKASKSWQIIANFPKMRLFSRLPFIVRPGLANITPCYGFAALVPESTGNDQSVWLLKTNPHSLPDWLKQHPNVKTTVIDGAQPLLLLTVDGFIPTYEKLTELLGQDIPQALAPQYLGTYAAALQC